MLDEQSILRRRPLWVALSGLWLDTELSDDDLEHIARVMVASGLSLAELRDVHLDEVAPVVSSNLFSMVGVWAGFDEEWLCSRIVRHLRGRRRRDRFWARYSVARAWRGYATDTLWQRLAALVRRAGDGHQAA